MWNGEVDIKKKKEVNERNQLVEIIIEIPRNWKSTFMLDVMRIEERETERENKIAKIFYATNLYPNKIFRERASGAH